MESARERKTDDGVQFEEVWDPKITTRELSLLFISNFRFVNFYFLLHKGGGAIYFVEPGTVHRARVGLEFNRLSNSAPIIFYWSLGQVFVILEYADSIYTHKYSKYTHVDICTSGIISKIFLIKLNK